MTTLRGSTAGAFTSNARTLTLPGGSVAGDYAVLFGYDGFSAPTLSNITGWTDRRIVTGVGDGVVAWKVLTSADITAGSVTITWSGSYGGYAALSTVAASSGVKLLLHPASTANTDTSSSRTSLVIAKNTDVALYFAFKRKDSTTPTVSIDRGTSVDASAVANVAGAFSTETFGADFIGYVTSTITSAGNADGIFVAVLGDTSATGGLDTSYVAASGESMTGFLYKGRATAAADTGANA